MDSMIKKIIKYALLFLAVNNGISWALMPGSDRSAHFQCVKEGDVESFLTSLLRTDLFRQEAACEGSLVHKTIKKAAESPLFIHVPSANKKVAAIERGNFTSWMNVLTLRSHEYKDPYFADLYLIHELTHITTMPYYESSFSFEDWERKMIDNELWASYVSEVLVFFELPSLREHFNIKKIWADRFLNDEIVLNPGMPNREFFEQSPEAFNEKVRELFKEIEFKSNEQLDDIELRTKKYRIANHEWCAIWKDDAKEVENTVYAFYDLAKTDSDRAISEHLIWLNEHAQEGVLYLSHLLTFEKNETPLEEVAELIENAEASFKETILELPIKMQNIIMLGKVTPTNLLKPSEALLGYGVTPTVYSFAWKEVEDLISSTWQKSRYQELYGTPYLRIQDELHTIFLDQYRVWAEPVVKGLDTFEYAYASNGSSEALKDTISYFLKTVYPNKALHVFEGEYEGAIHYAQAQGITVIKHKRDGANLDDLVNSIPEGDFFYITQPSSLEGNVWKDYDVFMELLNKKGVLVLLDIAYVGTVAKEYSVDVSYDNIKAVFFSLSKCFGVYYQRIGGCFIKMPHPLLEGNKWFKNVMSLKIGAELLRNFGVYELPRKYLPAQLAAVSYLKSEVHERVMPSDVVILATIALDGTEEFPDKVFDYLKRGHYMRFCLSPWMDTWNKSLHADDAVITQ